MIVGFKKGVLGHKKKIGLGVNPMRFIVDDSDMKNEDIDLDLIRVSSVELPEGFKKEDDSFDCSEVAISNWNILETTGKTRVKVWDIEEPAKPHIVEEKDTGVKATTFEVISFGQSSWDIEEPSDWGSEDFIKDSEDFEEEDDSSDEFDFEDDFEEEEDDFEEEEDDFEDDFEEEEEDDFEEDFEEGDGGKEEDDFDFVGSEEVKSVSEPLNLKVLDFPQKGVVEDTGNKEFLEKPKKAGLGYLNNIQGLYQFVKDSGGYATKKDCLERFTGDIILKALKHGLIYRKGDVMFI